MFLHSVQCYSCRTHCFSRLYECFTILYICCLWSLFCYGFYAGCKISAAICSKVYGLYWKKGEKEKWRTNELKKSLCGFWALCLLPLLRQGLLHFSLPHVGSISISLKCRKNSMRSENEKTKQPENDASKWGVIFFYYRVFNLLHYGGIYSFMILPGSLLAIVISLLEGSIFAIDRIGSNFVSFL